MKTTDKTQIVADLTACFELAIKIAEEEDEADRWGSERQFKAHLTAFEMAESFGWDWQEDETFQDWSLKATSVEILAYGLKRALEVIQAGAS